MFHVWACYIHAPWGLKSPTCFLCVFSRPMCHHREEFTRSKGQGLKPRLRALLTEPKQSRTEAKRCSHYSYSLCRRLQLNLHCKMQVSVINCLVSWDMTGLWRTWNTTKKKEIGHKFLTASKKNATQWMSIERQSHMAKCDLFVQIGITEIKTFFTTHEVFQSKAEAMVTFLHISQTVSLIPKPQPHFLHLYYDICKGACSGTHFEHLPEHKLTKNKRPSDSWHSCGLVQFHSPYG